MSPEQLFEQNLELIEQICARQCRRKCCFDADAEDFASLVKLKLIENDYARLRKFLGRSTIKTFLTTVVANQFRDYRNHKWGKWQLSAAARKLGETARQLETLRYRDGYPLREAIGILKTNYRVEESAAELEALAARFPEKTARRFESDDQLAEIAAEDRAEEAVLDHERSELKKKVESALARARAKLEAEDRLILKLRFEDGFTAASISRQLGIPQRRLYSRIEKSLKKLREFLEGEGMNAGDVLQTVGWDG